MASAGRILIIPRGEYDANETYEMLDLVNHNGFSWIAKKTVNGVEPIEGEYWHPFFKVSIANNLTTTEEGKVLDARQGKVLNDKIAHKPTFATFTVSAGGSKTLRLERYGVYFISTNVDALDTSCTSAMAYGGNNTNSSLNAKLAFIKNGTGVNYSVGTQAGKYNDVTVTNNSAYDMSLSILAMNGLGFTEA